MATVTEYTITGLAADHSDDERMTDAQYAKHFVYEYFGSDRPAWADFRKRVYRQNNNFGRFCLMEPEVDEGWYKLSFCDDNEDGYASTDVAFNTLRDAELLARAWVTRGR